MEVCRVDQWLTSWTFVQVGPFDAGEHGPAVQDGDDGCARGVEGQYESIFFVENLGLIVCESHQCVDGVCHSRS